MDRNNVESVYKLTPIQEGILFHSLNDKKAYLDQYSCKLTGDINVMYLIEAWQRVVDDNAVFRTAFVWENVSKILQVVVRKCNLKYEILDWTEYDENERIAKLAHYLSDELERGFQLDEPCLMRIAFIKTKKNEYYFVWNIHHIIIDGMSLPTMLGQVYENYHIRINGKDMIEHKSLPYKVYVDWLKKQNKNEGINYWKTYLKDIYEPTNLFVHKNESCVESKRYSIEMDNKLVEDLKVLARKKGVAVFQLYNLAYAILISKFTGKRDVLYGVTVSGRPIEIKGIAESVGLFINTVPNRMSFAEDKSCFEYIKKSISDQIERNKYEYVPLVDILDSAQMKNLQYDNIFLYENYSLEEIYNEKYIGFRISEEKISESTNYSLNWIVRPGHTTTINVVYDSMVVKENIIHTMVEFYCETLKQLVLNIEMLLSRFAIPCSQKFIPIKNIVDYSGENSQFVLEIDGKEWTKEKLTDIAYLFVKEQSDKLGMARNKTIYIYTNNLVKKVIYLLSATLTDSKVVIVGENIAASEFIEQVDFVFTDESVAMLFGEQYKTKMYILDDNLYERFLGSREYISLDNLNVNFKYSEIESSTIEEINGEYPELYNQTIIIDSEKFSSNFILRMIIMSWRRGNRIIVGGNSEAKKVDVVFTSSGRLMKYTNMNSVYLMLLDTDGYQLPSEEVKEYRILLSRTSCAELYCEDVKNNSVIFNRITLRDEYGNEVPRCFNNCLCFEEQKYWNNEKSPYYGTFKENTFLVVDKNRSGIANVLGVTIDLIYGAAVLKKELVKDCVIYGSDENYMVVCYSAREGFISEKTRRKVAAKLAEIWKLDKIKLKKIIKWFEVENIPREGNTIPFNLIEKRRKENFIDSISQESKENKKIAHAESETEKIIASIWGDILQRESIGIDYEFVALGGNSVDIMKIMSRVSSRFKVSLKIADMFKYATVRLLAEYVDELLESATESVEKLEYLSTKEEKSEGIIASYAQQRFWFLHQYEKKDTFYNISESAEINGEINVMALEKAINILCKRQESLRTVFAMKNGSVVQIIKDSMPIKLNYVDGCASIDEKQVINEFVDKNVNVVFDFESGPLFSCSLLKLEEKKHIFTLVIHHIISDGWSLSIFFNEMMQLYKMMCTDQDCKLNKVDWQYSQYTLWQRELLKGELLEQQLTYWKEKLDDVQELNLPIDFERMPIQSFKGKKVRKRFSENLKSAVAEMAKRNATTSYMVYLSAINVLFSRLCMQEDIVIGTSFGGRQREETENTIGCFLNTLVIRNKLKDTSDFKKVLKDVKASTLEAYSNKDIPFELLVDKLGVKRDLSKNPIFQVLFLFQNEPHPDENLDNLLINRIETNNNSSMVDLTISIQEELDVEVLFEYNTDLFRNETIERYVGYLENILKVMCENEERGIMDFDYMDQKEMVQILNEFNDTDVVFDSDKYIHELFQEQAYNNPNKIALKFEGESLTYAQLNSRINKLANYLISLGVRKNQMIAVYIERSIEMIVALYGILKAGAAYLPLDPSYPEERLKYMLEDSSVEIALIQKEKDALLKGSSIKIIELSEHDITESYSNRDPNIPIEESDYAYMIYTSGSTGKPKGVINTHKGIRNRILWIREYFPKAENGVQVQKTPFSFDVSLGEIFGALTVGACLVVAKPEGHKDVDYLVDLINEENITHIHFVPSMLKQFLASPRVYEAKTLKQVCCTGEPLPYSLVEKFKTIFNQCDLFNLYGPTEAAVEVTCWNCRDVLDKPIISIGKPMCNTQLYILDKNLRPVPVGVCGELYIAGDNLAVGYHNRQGLTAERFISNPFGSEKNSIMYKTGDFAKYLPDGNIDFIGRIDNQVKIRGNRIEIGEIETNIAEYGAIKEVNVIISKEETPRIVAYVVLNEGYDNEEQRNQVISELRVYLEKSLPEYMIPSFFIILDAMPLLPNGKLNMKELPLPAVSREYSTNQYAEVEDETQAKIKEIWMKHLEIEKVGIDDNFFEIGGHSLLLIQVYNDLKTEFQEEFSLVDLFKYPTIRGVSQYLYNRNYEGSKNRTNDIDKESMQKLAVERRKNAARLRQMKKV